MKHLHYQFVAYVEKEGREFIGGTLIDVLDCANEEEALEKVKTVLQRPLYHLMKVWECSTCSTQQEQLANSRYLTTLLGKHLKNDESNSD